MRRPQIADRATIRIPTLLFFVHNRFFQRDNGVHLIALTMPCCQTYTERTNPEGIAELHALADSMRSVYPDMEYYDFMNDKRFVMEDFFNSSHLNEVGALKFTDIFKNEILPLTH